MSNHETFKFEVPPASEDTKAPGLLAGVGSGGFMDTQKSMFMQQVIEKEDRALGVDTIGDNIAKEMGDGLTPYQQALLDRVRRANTDPIICYARKSMRPQKDIESSQEIHKRVNPGYVEMPYESSNTRDYKYKPPPDFTREYMKADSDLHFAKFAAAALMHSVPLNKTSH